MRILFLAPRLPVPADTGGKIRTYHLLRQLARMGKVHLVSFNFDEHTEQALAELQALKITTTLVPVSEVSGLKKVMKVFGDPRPFSVTKYDSLQMHEVVNGLVRSRMFDVVHFDHIHMTHYGDNLNGLPSLVDEHNVEFRILEQCANVERSVGRKWIYRMQAAKMKLFERERIKKLSACSVVSEDDRILLRDMLGDAVPIYVFPNGVDTEYFRPSPRGVGGEENALVFTGSMDWLPNEDAMIYFVREILPLLWKEHADLKLYVVGKSPSKVLQELSSKDSRIQVTGRVDDVRKFVDRAKIFVVPIRVGGGTRLKILEAMSMQKPVVSTTVGAEGIRHQNGTNILLADDPPEFARQVSRLLKDSRLCHDIGGQARKLVVERYDWTIIGNKMKKVYEELLNG